MALEIAPPSIKKDSPSTSTYQKFNNKVAVICVGFPPLKPTDTYTVTEMEAFEKMGLEVSIFTRAPKENTSISHNVKAPIFYMPVANYENIPPETFLQEIKNHMSASS